MTSALSTNCLSRSGSRNNGSPPRLTCLDLFCGCGGFTLGMERAGFHTLAAIDNNPEAIAVFRHNFPHIPHVLEKDLTRFRPEELDEILQGECVDVIVGGPPCQGFSNARRRDGSNHGPRVKEDARRYLYQEFLAYVAYFRPRVFVMENVLGIKTAAGGEFYTRLQTEARQLGYRVHGDEVCAWHYGVPQKRVRQLIIGTRRELPVFTTRRFMPPTHVDVAQVSNLPYRRLPAGTPSEPPGPSGSEIRDSANWQPALQPPVTLWEAIGDLPPLAAGEGAEEADYDLRRRQSQLARYGGRYLKRVLQIHRAHRLTAHTARPHSDRDLRDFARLNEGESSAAAMRRGVVFEWPYSKDHFRDRYTRQHRHRLCSTIVAHLSKDGLMFIHPTQNRTLTPREAARVQSFPDWFEFPVARTHQFRLIGNAVPPLVGEAVGRAVRRYLAAAERNANRRHRLQPLPQDERQAIEWLLPLVAAAEENALEALPDPVFKRGWFSLGFIHNRLHPDSVLENGDRKTEGSTDFPLIRRVAPELVTPVFAQSGWPVKLVPVAREAARRFFSGQLRECEFYCSEALVAGAKRADKGGRV
jgi:DNA (cytosine-5)-methyltransferase 1